MGFRRLEIKDLGPRLRNLLPIFADKSYSDTGRRSRPERGGGITCNIDGNFTIRITNFHVMSPPGFLKMQIGELALEEAMGIRN